MNDCKYRGYVLDGYPRNHADCEKIFMVREEDGLPDIKEFVYPKPKKEGEEEEEVAPPEEPEEVE